MEKIENVTINGFKKFIQECDKNAYSTETKSEFAIKHQLKKQIKFIEKALLTIPTTKKGKSYLMEELRNEKDSVLRYSSTRNSIGVLDAIARRYSSLGMFLIALSETKNIEVAEMEIQDIKENRSLQLDTPHWYNHYKETAELVLKVDGVKLDNILDGRNKPGFFVIHGMPAQDMPINEEPCNEPNTAAPNTDGPNTDGETQENTNENDATPSNFEDFDM